jgi:hypothetical protein
MSPAPHAHRPVLLIGSAPPRSAETVFREAGTRLGALAPCLPDGDQAGWIMGVFSTYVHHPDLEQSRVLVMDGAGTIKTPMYRLRPGHELRNLRLGPFGFATHAARSYEVFKRLRQQGVIAAGTRFQVSLPSPLISIMVLEHPFAETLPAIVAALGREIEAIRAAVPAADLAIQWDVCEPIMEETLRRPGHPTPFYKDLKFHWTMDQALDSLQQVSDPIPGSVKLGFHLCYGSAGGEHSIEPGDAGLLVEFMNGIVARLARRVDWIHIPVPIARSDAGYFAPLAGLKIRPETRIYLGLVHQEDGVDGARKRIDAARTVLPEFGVATECGLVQVPAGYEFTDLLDLHREVAQLPV